MRDIDPKFKADLAAHPLMLIHEDLICATIEEVGGAIIKMACDAAEAGTLNDDSDKALVEEMMDATFEKVLDSHPEFNDPELRELFEKVYEQYMMDRAHAPREGDKEYDGSHHNPEWIDAIGAAANEMSPEGLTDHERELWICGYVRGHADYADFLADGTYESEGDTDGEEWKQA